MPPMPHRRWYQFSMKTLLVLLTLLCVGPGGYVVYVQWKAKELTEAVKAIRDLNCEVSSDSEAPPRSALQRLILGSVPSENVDYVRIGFFANCHVTDADLKYVRPFPHLKELILSDCDGITDTGLQQLSGLRNLKYLHLDNTRTTDAGLVPIAGLKTLRLLSLKNTQVTPEGVAELQKALPNCRIER